MLDTYAIRFSQKLRAGEDRIFLFGCLLKAKKVLYLENIFGYIHISRKDSLTAEKDSSFYREYVFEQCKNMWDAELAVMQNVPDIVTEDIEKVQMERLRKSTVLIIQNEKRANFKKIYGNINRWKREEFFSHIVSKKCLFHAIKEKDYKRVVCIICMKIIAYLTP